MVCEWENGFLNIFNGITSALWSEPNFITGKNRFDPTFVLCTPSSNNFFTFSIFYKENFLFCWVKLSHDGGRCKHKSANVLLHTATHLINWMHLKGWETEGWRQNILKILKRSSTQQSTSASVSNDHMRE